MTSVVTGRFWTLYRGLPIEIRQLAVKNYYRAVGQ